FSLCLQALERRAAFNDRPERIRAVLRRERKRAIVSAHAKAERRAAPPKLRPRGARGAAHSASHRREARVGDELRLDRPSSRRRLRRGFRPSAGESRLRPGGAQADPRDCATAPFPSFPLRQKPALPSGSPPPPPSKPPTTPLRH